MANRSFSSSFASINDFNGFYLTPNGATNCDQSLATDKPWDGTLSHKGIITGSNGATNSIGLPHRGYPTIQLYKTAGGSFSMPCRIVLMIWASIPLGVHGTDDWFSPITFTDDETDAWIPPLTLSLGPQGYLSWFNVPYENMGEYIYQASQSIGGPKFPWNKWVRLEMEIDLHPVNGYAKVWQDNILVSHAQVLGRANRLAQIHAGMYASSAIASGVVYNGAIEIDEGMKSRIQYAPNGFGIVCNMKG